MEMKYQSFSSKPRELETTLNVVRRHSNLFSSSDISSNKVHSVSSAKRRRSVQQSSSSNPNAYSARSSKRARTERHASTWSMANLTQLVNDLVHSASSAVKSTFSFLGGHPSTASPAASVCDYHSDSDRYRDSPSHPSRPSHSSSYSDPSGSSFGSLFQPPDPSLRDPRPKTHRCPRTGERDFKFTAYSVGYMKRASARNLPSRRRMHKYRGFGVGVGTHSRKVYKAPSSNPFPTVHKPSRLYNLRFAKHNAQTEDWETQIELFADTFKHLNVASTDEVAKQVEALRQRREAAERARRKAAAVDKKIRPLTAAEMEEVRTIMRGDPSIMKGTARNPFISEISGIEMTAKWIRCLHPGTWLNDEVINFFMVLLQERSIARNKDKSLPPERRCLAKFFNTFFFTKLSGDVNGVYNYKKVRRWTSKLKLKPLGVNDIFELDRVFVPIHVNISHWVLACLNMKTKTIEYYDSMGGSNSGARECLRRYLMDEWKDKRGEVYTGIDDWKYNKFTPGIDMPEQLNGCDCGVFTCKNADYISDGRTFTFTQEHTATFRYRMVLEIYHKQIDCS
eukprot:253826_1